MAGVILGDFLEEAPPSPHSAPRAVRGQAASWRWLAAGPRAAARTCAAAGVSQPPALIAPLVAGREAH